MVTALPSRMERLEGQRTLVLKKAAPGELIAGWLALRARW